MLPIKGHTINSLKEDERSTTLFVAFPKVMMNKIIHLTIERCHDSTIFEYIVLYAHCSLLQVVWNGFWVPKHLLTRYLER